MLVLYCSVVESGKSRSFSAMDCSTPTNRLGGYNKNAISNLSEFLFEERQEVVKLGKSRTHASDRSCAGFDANVS